MYLSGEFHDKELAIRSLQDLKANGFAPDDLDVFSNEPLDLPRSVLDRRSHMSLAAVTGAIISCLLTVAFVRFTQYNYPLITGGMPIFSFWATGVVFYELTLFGAIVTIFFWFLLEGGLLRRRRPPAPAVEPGVICLRVRCESDQADTAGRCLESAGAGNIKRNGEAA